MQQKPSRLQNGDSQAHCCRTPRPLLHHRLHRQLTLSRPEHQARKAHSRRTSTGMPVAWVSLPKMPTPLRLENLAPS